MRILFFIVHPAKFRMFRDTINTLKRKGHTVDWVIVTKDTLEDFTKDEGWEYTNIFPEGRRIKGIPILLATVINMFRTLFRLFKYTWGKKYDLYVSSDILSFVGWIKRVPTLIFQDEDYDLVKEYGVIWLFATKVVSPEVCDLGPFNYKKLGYKGSHKWAYCNPKYFKPDISKVKSFNPKMEKYFFLRLVSMTASHDRGKKGLTDDNVEKLLSILTKHGKVYIASERELKPEWEKYRLDLKPVDHLHAMYYAQMYIGDSQSMVSEAGLLGTPAIRFNEFKGRVPYLREEEGYGLLYSFDTTEFDKMITKIEEILKITDVKAEWKKRVQNYAKDHIDTTQFYIDLIESYDKGKSKK